MSWLAGVDGCRGGWFVVLAQCRQGIVHKIQYRLCVSFKDVLDLMPRPKVIAIDIPIGLLNEPFPGGRNCDREARQLLGRPRASSVFSPPIRQALLATTKYPVNGYRMSKQTFNILPKIKQVDELMTPKLQNVIYEVHPEVCFKALAGHAMRHNKKTALGREERLYVLEKSFHRLREDLGGPRFPDVSTDDILDAYAATWTAIRIVNHQAQCIPHGPPVDAKGLRMEIWH